MEVVKTCKDCGQAKGLEQFNPNVRGRQGRKTLCRVCEAARARKRRQLFPEKQRAADARYRAKNAAKLNKRSQDWKRNNPEKARDQLLRYRFGISLLDYNRMNELQRGLCAICGNPNPRKTDSGLVVDHCHATGKVRGLLCHSCNTALGHLRDSVENLKAAIVYLESRSSG